MMAVFSGLADNSITDAKIATHTTTKITVPETLLTFTTNQILSDLKSITGVAGDIIYFNGTNWVKLGKDANKFLKSGASAVSWDTPAGGGSAGEGHIFILGSNYNAIVQGSWAINIDVTTYLNGYFYNSGANGDKISFQVYLDAGTYTLRMLCDRNTDKGIVTFDIDGTDVATFDTYNASVQLNYAMSQTGITVASAGLKTLSVRLNGKTGSGYLLYLICLALWRTA